MVNGTERYLTPDEYTVYPGEPLIQINTCLDSYIEENRTVGVDVFLDAWNGFKYTPGVNGVVFIEAKNETHTWNLTDGVDYLWWSGDKWWYLNPVPGLDKGDTLRIGYWTVSTLEVFYKTVEPDPTRYIEFIGTYDEFLTSTYNPVCSTYEEIYPVSWRSPYHVVEWMDEDISGHLNAGDKLILEYIDTGETGIYIVDEVATDITINQLPVICDRELTCKFYAMEPDVKISGQPYPDRQMCPWHNQESSPLLPHKTEPATFTAFAIDLTPPIIQNVTQFPDKDHVEPTDTVYINATVIDDESGIENVTLWYRIQNGTWNSINMTHLTGNIYNATIPAHPYCTTIEYYIEAYNKQGNKTISPTTGYYSYHVIPEFPHITIIILTLLTILTTTIIKRKNKQNKK